MAIAADEGCLWCGAPLPEDRAWSRLFCDARCQWRAASLRRRVRRWPDILEDKTCARCGAAFDPRGGKKYCSRLCASRACSVRVPVAHSPRPCAACGTLFQPVRANHACCSHACANRVCAARTGPPQPAPKPCAVCGAIYQPKRADSLCCSHACACKHWRRRQKSGQAEP